jgi:tRNA threonylcarbamoyladenosine biosynthesis protein TsaE
VITIEIADESKMLALGRSWAERLDNGQVLFLSGELGVGKTTLVRGVLSGLGYDGIVSSPTYTLVEPYLIQKKRIFHFDFYRVKSLEELEMIGVRDMITPDTVCLIEWPDRGSGLLPEPDYAFDIQYLNTGRRVEITRHNK